jgi:hypothetical protein
VAPVPAQLLQSEDFDFLVASTITPMSRPTPAMTPSTLEMISFFFNEAGDGTDLIAAGTAGTAGIL